jgi:hypothetical protein
MPSAVEIVDGMLSACVDAGIAPAAIRLHPTTYAEYVASTTPGPPNIPRNRQVSRRHRGRAELIMTVEIVADESVPAGSIVIDSR